MIKCFNHQIIKKNLSEQILVFYLLYYKYIEIIHLFSIDREAQFLIQFRIFMIFYLYFLYFTIRFENFFVFDLLSSKSILESNHQILNRDLFYIFVIFDF
jgi:hypothetical protein